MRASWRRWPWWRGARVVCYRKTHHRCKPAATGEDARAVAQSGGARPQGA
ncbi:hypothetical protein LG3211_1639 [Lysobacter gummosus]|nr:hypothetical protein LG3211_1639 [Lysobacter gummosus]